MNLHLGIMMPFVLLLLHPRLLGALWFDVLVVPEYSSNSSGKHLLKLQHVFAYPGNGGFRDSHYIYIYLQKCFFLGVLLYAYVYIDFFICGLNGELVFAKLPVLSTFSFHFSYLNSLYHQQTLSLHHSHPFLDNV